MDGPVDDSLPADGIRHCRGSVKQERVAIHDQPRHCRHVNRCMHQQPDRQLVRVVRNREKAVTDRDVLHGRLEAAAGARAEEADVVDLELREGAALQIHGMKGIPRRAHRGAREIPHVDSPREHRQPARVPDAVEVVPGFATLIDIRQHQRRARVLAVRAAPDTCRPELEIADLGHLVARYGDRVAAQRWPARRVAEEVDEAAAAADPEVTGIRARRHEDDERVVVRPAACEGPAAVRERHWRLACLSLPAVLGDDRGGVVAIDESRGKRAEPEIVAPDRSVGALESHGYVAPERATVAQCARRAVVTKAGHGGSSRGVDQARRVARGPAGGARLIACGPAVQRIELADAELHGLCDPGDEDVLWHRRKCEPAGRYGYLRGRGFRQQDGARHAEAQNNGQTTATDVDGHGSASLELCAKPPVWQVRGRPGGQRAPERLIGYARPQGCPKPRVSYREFFLTVLRASLAEPLRWSSAP